MSSDMPESVMQELLVMDSGGERDRRLLFKYDESVKELLQSL